MSLPYYIKLICKMQVNNCQLHLLLYPLEICPDKDKSHANSFKFNLCISLIRFLFVQFHFLLSGCFVVTCLRVYRFVTLHVIVYLFTCLLCFVMFITLYVYYVHEDTNKLGFIRLGCEHKLSFQYFQLQIIFVDRHVLPVSCDLLR